MPLAQPMKMAGRVGRLKGWQGTGLTAHMTQPSEWGARTVCARASSNVRSLHEYVMEMPSPALDLHNGGSPPGVP